MTIKKHSRICADHFQNSDFIRTTASLLQLDTARHSLKKTAVPSIFPWKCDLQRSSSTSQDEILFSDTNPKNTYEHILPLTYFVEEPLHVDIPENDEDPLKSSHETSECDLENGIELAQENKDINSELGVSENLEIPTNDEFFEVKLPDSIEKLENEIETAQENNDTYKELEVAKNLEIPTHDESFEAKLQDNIENLENEIEIAQENDDTYTELGVAENLEIPTHDELFEAKLPDNIENLENEIEIAQENYDTYTELGVAENLEIPAHDELFEAKLPDSTERLENEIEIAQDNNGTYTELGVAENLEIPTHDEFFEDKLPDNIETLEKSVQKQSCSGLGFSLQHYKDDDGAIRTYTGLENFKKFMLVFDTLGQCAFKLNYFYGMPPKHIDTLEQFFITLFILRRRESMEMIAALYCVSVKQIYNIFITWIRFMSLQWKNLDLWVSKERVKEHMPSDFYDKYPSTRVILKAIECPIKKPKLPFAEQVSFSLSKDKSTVKFVIGITPGGLISYVSPCYAGSATDRQIIERSSILQRFDDNDEVMVDEGLHVRDIFLPYGVKVNQPSRKIANVEKVIRLLKTYKILSHPMNPTETHLASDIVFVCAMLVNFQSRINNKYA